MHGTPGGRIRGLDQAALDSAGSSGKFGRMFPGLEPLAADPGALAELAEKMVDDGGVSHDNFCVPAGHTFLGQFIDHDITFDPTTLKEALVDPGALSNYRTPALDLDHLYGRGPTVDPHYYNRSVGGAEVFVRGSTKPAPPLPALPLDLPRQMENFRALIPDPRNDENLIIAQMHMVMMLFHNAVVTALENNRIPQDTTSGKTIFEQARDIVISHYRWIVLHDFLPAVVNPDVLKKVMRRGSRVFSGRGVFMPVEFSAAAFRFGHSLIRETYDVNPCHNSISLGNLFLHAGGGGPFVLLPIPSDHLVDWRRFFAMDPAVRPQPSRAIDPYLAPELAKLQTPSGNVSLAEMNLLRGLKLGLPSGQAVARYYGCTPLQPEAIASSGEDGRVAKDLGFDVESPLWYYVLKEAQAEGGCRLGPVGSRIVAETFVGLLQHDASSPAGYSSEWKPFLKSATPGHFTMADLIGIAQTEFGSGSPV